jgi:hypothetical protein
MIGPESGDTARYRRARHAMEEEKIKNSGIGRAPVILMVLRYVNADFLTRSRFKHIVLLKLESSLTNQKFCHSTQQSATGMHSVFELLMESLQLRAKLRAISFHDFINQCLKSQRDKLLQFPGVVQAKTSLGFHPFDEQGALKLLCQFTQAGYLFLKDTVAQHTFIAVHFSNERPLQHFEEHSRDNFARCGASK